MQLRKPVLVNLDIQGFVLIKKVSIDFSEGFHVITGETGAGKSILIKALHLLLGAKASADTVKKGCKQATVSGSFLIADNHDCFSLLKELGIPFQKENPAVNLILRRTISAKGRSYAWVNDTPLTIGSLKELGLKLIDIFAQHDNQKLLDESSHTQQVDYFLPNEGKCLNKYQKIYKKAWNLYLILCKKISNFSNKQQNQDYLLFRHEEIVQFDPSKEDFASLVKTCQQAEKTIQEKYQINNLSSFIDQGASGRSISQALWTSKHQLEQLKSEHKPLKKLIKLLDAQAHGLDDLSYELSKAQEFFHIDENMLEDCQARLADYQKLFRKVGAKDIDDFLSIQQQFQKEIAFLEDASSDISSILDELLVLCQDLKYCGEELQAQRKTASSKINIKVKKEFSDLAMNQASLQIDFIKLENNLKNIDLELLDPCFKAKYEKIWQDCKHILESHKEEGPEKIRFLLTTNPGEDPKPLSKIASGGEVSRIMLALKRALLTDTQTCILVFDEIDTGISGRIADMVGKKLRHMSRKAQIICISHLAQVAAYADHHLTVLKVSDEKSNTRVTLKNLKTSDKISEIARLLSGDQITNSSLANAKNLIKRCHVSLQ